jgi:hypothetical protein
MGNIKKRYTGMMSKTKARRVSSRDPLVTPGNVVSGVSEKVNVAMHGVIEFPAALRARNPFPQTVNTCDECS